MYAYVGNVYVFENAVYKMSFLSLWPLCDHVGHSEYIV